MYKVVMIRHGESIWNQENRFTGWTDVELTAKGCAEATLAGEALKAKKFIFDIAYTSLLRRSIKTLNIVLDVMDQLWIPVVKDWRLNERHYGALQGLNKSETAQKYGDGQVKIWRRSYDVPPPEIDEADERFPGKCPQYASLLPHQLPKTECLKDTVERFLPFWHETIVPFIKKGNRVMIAAHGNSIRAAVKYLDAMSEHDIVSLNIPTGIPLVYELDDTLKPIKHYYIGDEEAIRKAADAVANQGTA